MAAASLTQKKMKLKKIKAIGLQGNNFTHALGQLALITGDNGSGKTAIAHAIQLALLGHLPRLGKTGPATAGLASGSPLEVQLSGEAGESIYRSWTIGRAVKMTSRIEGLDEKELEAVIPAALDFSEFIQAKPTERQRILEAVMGESRACERIAEQLARLPGDIATIYSSEETLQGMEKKAAEETRAAKQEVDRLKKSLQQIEVEEAEDLGVDYDAEAHKAAKQKLEDLKIKIGVLTDRLDSISDARQRAPEEPATSEPTAEQLQKIEAAYDRENTIAQEAAEIRRMNREIEQEVAKLKEKTRILSEQPTLDCKPERPLPTDLEIERQKASVTLAKQRENDVNRRLDGLEAILQRIKKERDEKIDLVTGCQTCPTCGQESSDSLEEVIAGIYEKQIEEVDAKLKVTKTELQSLDAELLQERAALATREELVDDWRAFDRHSEIVDLEEQIANRVDDMMVEPGINPVPARELSEARETLSAWKIYRAAKVPTAEEEADTLEELTGERAKLKVFEAGLEGMERAQQANRAAADRQRRRAELETELVNVEAELQNHQSIRSWAKETSLQDTTERLQPLLGPANEILEGVVKGRLSIEGSAIGLEVGDRFRRLKVLCGAELAAVAAAVQSTLAKASGFPIVIVDELSRLRTERRAKLLYNLADQIEQGILGNVIATDHDEEFVDGFVTGHGVQVEKIKLEGGAQ